MKFLILILFFVSINSFAQLPKVFIAEDQPFAPNYSTENNWVALPFVEDKADIIPNAETWVSDSLKKVDVFFIYPTLYTRKSAKTWTADILDKKVNRKVKNQTIRYQASVFNKSTRIYAPRYRQAHVDVFDNMDSLRYKVLDFAYQDVKRAFIYYLNNYNNDRPIIIASHSQGTVHARRLLKEFFENEKMKSKLVCAYLVGFGVYPKDYKTLTLCKNADETNCFVTWSSFKDGFDYELSKGDYLVGETSVNPISWDPNNKMAEGEVSILLSVKSAKKYHTEARLKDNMLWVKTKTPLVKSWNIMHLVDYNLFWYSIRENVKNRIDKYFEKKT